MLSFYHYDNRLKFWSKIRVSCDNSKHAYPPTIIITNRYRYAYDAYNACVMYIMGVYWAVENAGKHTNRILFNNGFYCWFIQPALKCDAKKYFVVHVIVW